MKIYLRKNFVKRENKLFLSREKRYSIRKRKLIKRKIKKASFSIIFFALMIFAFLVFLILIIFKRKNKRIEFNNQNNIGNIMINKSYIYFNPSPRKEVLLRGKDYINKCLNDNFVKKFEKVENPILSIIIPVFNCEKYIKGAISSIQNQNFTEIEILLINDFSSDKTLNIIQEIEQNDKRIKIINNEKNMGSLYSRCIGSLMAKGAHIFPLDNDDMFFQEDVFDSIYKITIKGNFDIIGFKSVYVKNYTDDINNMVDGFFTYKPNNLILFQPELGRFSITINGNYVPNDYTIWGKCIKTEIYQKATNSMGKERYSNFLSWAEDSSIIFVIFNIAQSYIFVHKYGIMHLISQSTATFTQPLKNKLKGEIFLSDVLFDFSKNNSDKDMSAMHANYIKLKYGLNNIIENENIRLYYKTVLEKIINSTYVSPALSNQIKTSIYDKIIN